MNSRPISSLSAFGGRFGVFYVTATLLLLIVLSIGAFLLTTPYYAEKIRERLPSFSFEKKKRTSRRSGVFLLQRGNGAAQWQHASLAYLGICTCLFSLLFFLPPLEAGTGTTSFINGSHARVPVNFEYLNYQELPEAENILFPLAPATLLQSGPPPRRNGDEIADANADYYEDDATAESNYRGLPPLSSPTEQGLVCFEDGQVSIRTAEGDVIVTRQDGLPAFIYGKEAPRITRHSPLHASSKWFSVAGKTSKAYRNSSGATLCSLDTHDNRANLNKLLSSLQPSPSQTALHSRKDLYTGHAQTFAEKYNLESSLILAIMHTESGFNPHAVSPRQAIGLMQIVPHSAGTEVYRFLKGQYGPPSADALFNPETNIRYGAVYLHLLDRYYFAGVENQTARLFCVIAAYNGGPNAVMRHFSPNRQLAIKKINSMTPQQVYKTLTTRFPYAETRRYVQSVKTRMENYSLN